jgi:cytoskeleton protein RodZ
VGQDLRAARLRRGDDLASVSRSLKIRKDHLEAIEEDHFELLPGRAYAVGFLRSYADYLGLDPVHCVERYKLEIAGRGEAVALPSSSGDTMDESRLPHGWLVIAAVVLGLFVFGAYHLATSADSLVNQPVAAVPAQIAPKPQVVVQKPKPAPVQVQAPPQTTLATTQAPDSTLPPTLPGQSPAAIAPDSAGAPAALPQGQAYGAQNKGARVILRVKAATRVLVQGPDGRIFINRTLQPGDTYQVPLVPGVTLTTSNGEGVEVDLDGQSMGAASRNGDVT